MFNLEIPQNYQQYLDYLPFFLFGLVASFLLAPFVGFIARKLNIVDYNYAQTKQKNPKKSDFRRLKKSPQALLGGVTIIIPWIIIILSNTKATVSILYFVVALILILVMGVLDDKYDLPGTTQYTVHIIATLLIVLSPINLSFITNPFDTTISLNLFQFETSLLNIPIDIVFPGDILLMVWILVCMNAIKFFIGTDGVGEGNTLISSLVIFLLSVRTGDRIGALMSISLVGLLLGFLFYSFPFGLLRTGSSGKVAYGFILGTLAMMTGDKIPVAIILLMLPFFDLVRVTIRRIIKHKPKSIKELLSISDQTHFQHRLLDLGFSEIQIALTEYAITLALGGLALAYTESYRGLLLFLAGFSVITIYIAIKIFHAKRDKNSRERSPESKYSY